MPLHTMLVTGDSMSEPLDQDLAQALEPQGTHVIQDPHIGTGIYSTLLVDWGKLSVYQVKQYHPNAVVVFIGANDGYSMPGPGGKQVNCCGAEWATIYAQRVRQMMNAYRQAGVARVYWLTCRRRATAPGRRSRRWSTRRSRSATASHGAIRSGSLTRYLCSPPANQYRDSMLINGQPTIVRESDGIHLNDAGSSLAAQVVLAAVDKDFTP